MEKWDLINKIRRFFRTSWVKSLYFNFLMLPFRQAIHLPIILTRYTYFYSLPGKIVLKEKPRFGMIRMGYLGEDHITPKDTRTLLQIEGVWETEGNVHFGCGVILRIEKDATFVTEHNVRISNRSKIICYDSIHIGPDTRIAWDCQLIDTSFHYMRNIDDRSIIPLTAPVKIGAHNWIGNRCNIMKGAVLPDYTIVASGSLCNKKYDIPEYSLMAGSPSKLIKTGIYRCLDEEEREIKAKLRNKER